MNKLDKYKVELKDDMIEFVSTIITDNKGRPLILKRSDKLKLDPGKYDMCSGHMKHGETPIQSAYRELKEELGINQEDIVKFSHLGEIETPHPKFPNTSCHVYHIITNLTEEEINKKIVETEKQGREIESARFLKDIDELIYIQRYTKLMKTLYTDGMKMIFEKLSESIDKGEENHEKKSNCR